VNTGPGLNSNSWLSGLKMVTPMTSEGRRSDVNWMRLNVHPSERLRAEASVVLPTPGMSSIRRCPFARSDTTASLTTSSLPQMTF